MKPLNDNGRNGAIAKFLLANVLALSMVAYSVYSFVFVKENITTDIKSDTNEVRALEDFLNKAEAYVDNFDDAESDTDRAKYSLELNRLILDSKETFETNSGVYNIVSERYKSSLRDLEMMEKMGSAGDQACAEKTKSLDREIEDLEAKLDKLSSSGEDAKRAKAAIERIASDVVKVADDINALDWCPGIASGNGRSEIKSELKQRLGTLRSELLAQAGRL